MIQQQFRKSLSDTALRVRKYHGLRYQDIKISSRYQIVVVDHIFFAQGESADAIITEIDKMVEFTSLAHKTCLLAYLESAGVI